MNKNKRDYSCSDINMLLVSQVVAQNFKNHIDELVFARANWNRQYADTLVEKIDATMESKLGINPKAPLANATVLVNQIMKPAMDSLATLKVHLGIDIADKQELKRILSDLGFTKNFVKMQKKDQEAVIEFLYTYNKGMTPELRSRLTQTVPVALIDEISGYGEQLKNANVTQESLKLSLPLITGETIAALNAVYREIIGVCKIASNHYKSSRKMKTLFSFSNILNNLQPVKKPLQPAA